MNVSVVVLVLWFFPPPVADDQNITATLSKLTSKLQDQDPDVRRQAATSLGQIGPAAHAAVPDLVLVLTDDHPKVRRQVVLALGLIGSKAAVPALIKSLNDPDQQTGNVSNVCQLSAMALAAIGPDAKAAARPLLQIIRKPGEERLHAIAVYAVAKIAPEDRDVKDIVPAIIEILKDPRLMKALWPAATRALGDIGPKAKDGVPVLIDIIEMQRRKTPDYVTDIKIRSVDALTRMGIHAKPAMNVLIRLVQDSHADPRLRAAAANALGDIGQSTKTVISVLEEAQEDNDVIVSQAAKKVLRTMRH